MDNMKDKSESILLNTYHQIKALEEKRQKEKLSYTDIQEPFRKIVEAMRFDLFLYHCLRCGWNWRSRKAGDPKRCANPKCRSPYWNKLRKK